MTTTVTTDFKTYVNVSGDVQLRIQPVVWPGPSEGFCLAFSDGTLLFCGYTPCGHWRFDPLAKGMKWLSYTRVPSEEGWHCDEVILRSNIAWVAVVDQDKYAQNGDGQ